MLKKNGSNSVGLNSGRTNVREARRHRAIGQRVGGNEHRLRPHPKTTVAVEHFINDEDFLCTAPRGVWRGAGRGALRPWIVFKLTSR